MARNKKPDWESAQKRDRIREHSYVAVSTILYTSTTMPVWLAKLDQCAHRKVAPAARGKPIVRKGGTLRIGERAAREATSGLGLVDCDRCHNAFLARALAAHIPICPGRPTAQRTKSSARHIPRRRNS